MSGDDAVDGEAIVERVREARATELDRLGSEKALVAITDAVLESERVLARTAEASARAAATYGAWADDETEAAARAAFEEAAAEREHVDRLVSLGAPDPGDPGRIRSTTTSGGSTTASSVPPGDWSAARWW